MSQMANPLYLFFSSRAGIAGTVLRWTMAAFVLHLAVWQILHLSGQAAGGEELLLPWLKGIKEVSWSSSILYFALGTGLLFGVFTRACALLLLVWVVAGISGIEAPSGAEVREALLSACICLTLTISGGGRLSVDRRISGFFMPNL